VSTVAGSGAAGYVDAKGTGASFHYPHGMAIDTLSNIVRTTNQPHTTALHCVDHACLSVTGNDAADDSMSPITATIVFARLIKTVMCRLWRVEHPVSQTVLVRWQHSRSHTTSQLTVPTMSYVSAMHASYIRTHAYLRSQYTRIPLLVLVRCGLPQSSSS
jgi:hypothetical protein